MADQPDLEWVDGQWSVEPRWTREPSLDTVARTAHRHLHLSGSAADDDDATTEPFNQGALNKLYKVSSVRGAFVMRISLPVDPRFKTLSEVGTLDLLRTHTSIPVPKVIAFDASCENELGFEWILMDYMPGTRLEDVWAAMTWAAKCVLVGEVADVTAQLFRLRGSAVGNVYRAGDVSESASRVWDQVSGGEVSTSPVQEEISGGEASEETGIIQAIESCAVDGSSPSGYSVGRIVSMAFFWHKHVALDVARGPFASSGEWLASRLELTKYDCDDIDKELAEECESDDEENEITKILISRLVQLMPTFFPPADVEHLKSALCHDDMSHQNLMVNADGKLTALVDWECVSIVPLWKACQLPSFLEGRRRDEAPLVEEYLKNDDGTPNRGYSEDLHEYDLTRLREKFFQSMETIEPAWMRAFRASEAQADFGCAVENCDTPFCRTRVRDWLDAVDAGKARSSLRISIRD